MSFAHLHKVITYLFVGLGLLALSIGPHLSVVTELAIAIAFGASWFVEGTRIRGTAWIRGWTVALVGFLFLQVGRGFLGGSPLGLALEFTAFLQISRLFNRRGAKEHQQAGAIALLHLIAATVLSTEIAYAFVFAGFLIVAPWILTLGHLRAEIEASHPAASKDPEALARVLASKQLIGARYLGATAALAVPLFLMTGLVFVLFPRVGLGFLAFDRTAGQTVSGFGANVELGDFGAIRTDPTVVLRVNPPDLPARPPPRRSLRMRGTSFDRYDGRRWTRTPDMSQGVGRIGDLYGIPARIPDRMRDDAWGVVLDPLDEPVVFLPPDTVGLSVSPRVVGGLNVGRDLTIAPGVDIRYDGDGLGLRYTAYTAPPQSTPPEEFSPEMARRYLQLPSGHEEVGALALEWTRGAQSDRERVSMILSRLRDSGAFTYSLEMPEVGERVPLDVFLFEARRGHCEYFSTAMAVMLRSQGIPTRNVTGFLGGRWNTYGGYYALSQAEAHSWVEARVGGRWVTVDPTPAARSEIVAEASWLAFGRELLDAARVRWFQDVVGYDLRSQVHLFANLRRSMGGARPSSDTQASGDGQSTRWPLALIIAVLLALMAFLALRLLRRRRAARALVDDPDARRAVELLGQLERALEKRGWARPPHRTPREHAEELAARELGAATLVSEVVGRYVATRYGGAALGEEEFERMSAAIRDAARRRELFEPA